MCFKFFTALQIFNVLTFSLMNIQFAYTGKNWLKTPQNTRDRQAIGRKMKRSTLGEKMEPRLCTGVCKLGNEKKITQNHN